MSGQAGPKKKKIFAEREILTDRLAQLGINEIVGLFSHILVKKTSFLMIVSSLAVRGVNLSSLYIISYILEGVPTPVSLGLFLQ